MAWDPIDETELRPGFSILKHMRQAWNCVKFLYGQIGTMGASSVLNGSFEVDSDGNGQPDNWTLNTYPGGSGAIVTDVPAHGARALKLIHPGGAGNGGGYYESDYVTCSGLYKVYLGFIHWATAAGMRNQVVVRWYDKAKVFISSATIYDSTYNPTSATYFVMGAQPPANARFYKLQLVGGDPGTNVQGTAYFDGVGSPGFELLVSRTASATIAAVTTSSTDYVDVANMTFTCPQLGLPVTLRFDAEGKSPLGGTAGKQRFRVGANYSNEVLLPQQSTEYLNNTFSLFVPAGEQAGSVTVHMQLASGSGVTASGRKMVPDIVLSASL